MRKYFTSHRARLVAAGVATAGGAAFEPVDEVRGIGLHEEFELAAETGDAFAESGDFVGFDAFEVDFHALQRGADA